MAETVTFAAIGNYDPPALRPALERVLTRHFEAVGGISGRSVMIKPNLLACRRPDDPACVNGVLLLETARLLRDAGAAKIAVIENPAVETAPAVLRALGVHDQLADLGVSMANCSDYRRVNMPEGATFRQLELAQEFRDFDLVLNLAKAKTHGMMTLTLAVKNLFGLVRGSERLAWHLAVGRDYRRFAELLLDIHLAVKPQLNLLDAVIGMEGNGPGSGDPVKIGFIAAANDALALDSAVAPLLGVPELLELQVAAERGLRPEITCTGDTEIEVVRLRLPDPPELEYEWGVWFPARLRNFLRRRLVSRPVLHREACIGCGRCVQMCPPKSLRLVNGKPVFALRDCIRCYCCQEHCPCGAIVPRRTLLMRVADRIERILRPLWSRCRVKKRDNH